MLDRQRFKRHHCESVAHFIKEMSIKIVECLKITLFP